METNQKKLYTVRYLLSKSLEGKVTADEMRLLETLIIEDPAARRYYAELLHVHVSLRKLLQKDIIAIDAEDEGVLDVALWDELARHEQMAETVVVQPDDVHEDLSGHYPKEPPKIPVRPKISRFSMVSIAASIAAVLFVVLYVHLIPVPKPVVATLSDAVNARWDASHEMLSAGDDIRAESYRLLSGVISLKFESGTEVVIEGPADYQPTSSNKLLLQYGKAFAHVPERAIGFTIDTPQSSVVDLGTDFGVAVDPVMGSEIHVYQGKVNLVAGLIDQPKKSEILQQHEARKVEDDGTIRAAEFKKYLFAQKISSQENRVVYGRPVTLASLTDLIMGGNGYGTSRETSRIYAVSTGQTITDYAGQYRTLNNLYQPVSVNPFIDGFFVPDGNGQVVSSEGHVFAECPDTSGLYFYDLFFDRDARYAPPVAELYQKQRSLKFAPDIVFMHSNLGVTFDLAEVRRQFPAQSIRRFQTTAGTLSVLRGYGALSEEQLALNFTEFDVWIVVDGQLRAKAQRIHWDSLTDLDVPLTAADRFLSVVVTDGGIIRSLGNNENHYDLCGLADMRFEMESME